MWSAIIVTSSFGGLALDRWSTIALMCHDIHLSLPVNIMSWQDTLWTVILFALINRMLLDSHTLRATLVWEQWQRNWVASIWHRPVVRSHEDSKSRDLFLELPKLCKIWQVLWRRSCQITCTIFKFYNPITQWPNMAIEKLCNDATLYWLWNRPLISLKINAEKCVVHLYKKHAYHMHSGSKSSTKHRSWCYIEVGISKYWNKCQSILMVAKNQSLNIDFGYCDGQMGIHLMIMWHEWFLFAVHLQ